MTRRMNLLTLKIQLPIITTILFLSAILFFASFKKHEEMMMGYETGETTRQAPFFEFKKWLVRRNARQVGII